MHWRVLVLPVRAHTQVSGLILSRSMCRRQPIDVSLLHLCFFLFLPFPSSLSRINEKIPNISLGEDKKTNKFSLKQLQISLNVQLAEKWTVSQYTINISVAYIPKYWKWWLEILERKSCLKRDIIKWNLDLLSLKMEILFQLLIGSGREKSELFIQNRMTLFSISHTAV